MPHITRSNTLLGCRHCDVLQWKCLVSREAKVNIPLVILFVQCVHHCWLPVGFSYLYTVILVRCVCVCVLCYVWIHLTDRLSVCESVVSSGERHIREAASRLHF